MAEPVPSGSRGAPADRPADALARGARLGRYELLVPIAVGGMARVWAARLEGQRGFSKLVAIKTVLPHLASDPEFERMLVDEARIASRVRHPNVCEIYDLGEERSVVYIAMEWVEGDSLSNVLKGATPSSPTPIDPRVAARIVSEAAAGLHAAHNLVDDAGALIQVVHRDVSPHNVLVSLEGHVKVADFGVAKAVGASHQPTLAGQIKGKVSYMAPEQARGGEVDRRSDVFALGCVLYAVTTGRPPFQGEGEHQVLQELVKGAYLPPSRVVRGYPYELERIVSRAMSPQPLHRFQTMEQMRVALEEWIARSGPVVTHTHVAALVRERMGVVIDRRREQIRAASAVVVDKAGPLEAPVVPVVDAARVSATPSGVVPTPAREGSMPPGAGATVGRPSHVSFSEASAMPALTPAASTPPSAAQYFAASALGVLAASAFGAALFFVWRPSLPASPRSPVVSESPAATAPVVPSPTPSAGPVSSAARGSSAGHDDNPILFNVLPETAFLVVDGKALGGEVRSVGRPTAGLTQSVVVRADGYADQMLTLDERSPSAIDVWLDPIPKKGAPAPKGFKDRVPGEKPAKSSDPLPANPY